MLSFRKGTAGAPTAAQAMAEHLREQTLPPELTQLADYYLRDVVRSEAMGTAAIPRQDMAPEVAAALGLDTSRTAAHEEVVNLLRGYRADGERIAGSPQRYAQVKGRDRITYVDFTFSAPKSVSVAMALAPTDAERHIIVGAHRDAWMAAMDYAETIVGRARKGKGGSKGSVPGGIGWVSFDHYTSRPTVEIPVTEADGTRSTIIQTVRNARVPGDMQLHTHVTTPNVVVCADGSTGSMDMLALHDRVHEIGAYYQAHLATNLRTHGVAVVLDEKTETARLTAVPQAINDLFSKRTRDGEAAARDYVRSLGLDWDVMHPMELARVLKGGTRATRQGKGDDMSDLEAWHAQAKAAGYEHATVLRPEAKGAPVPTKAERLTTAYGAALPVLERAFERRAVMSSAEARVAAARGLIASGVETAADIGAVTGLMRHHGVRHAGETVPVIWAEVGGKTDAEPFEERRRQVKITTALHVAQEQEAIALAEKAAADPGGLLRPYEINRAVRTVTERDGLDFTTDHGREQRRVMDVLGSSGRLAVAIGVAGAGKTTLLRPLVEAWRFKDGDGHPSREVYGTALARRQSDQLADAGIPEENCLPVAAVLKRAAEGKLRLGPKTVLVVDELGQFGTSQALALLRLRDQHGFSMVALADDQQAQAIEAGNSVALLRKALVEDAIPELQSTVRQHRERDRETSLLFRQGDAEAGIARLREDGHVRLVQGGRKHAIEATADLWLERTEANRERAGYSLTISTPTNADARDVSAAIRDRRRQRAELGPDAVVVQATDQNAAEYDLPLAKGDRVRLFSWTRASFGEGRAGNIGNNGSVVAVEDVTEAGLRLRNAKGSVGLVKWDTLRDPESGRVRLTYGDAISIDAIQGATSTEHLNVLPSGSRAVHSFKNYVAQSRSRETTWLVVSDGRERSEIMERRALGNVEPIDEAAVWRNVAANLSRKPEKELATDLLRRSHSFYYGTVRSLATAFQPKQQREAEGREGTTLGGTFKAKRHAKAAAEAAPGMAKNLAQRAVAFRKVAGLLTGPDENEVRRAIREARRSVKAPAARPKKQRPVRQRPAPMSTSEAVTEFADALQRAGLRVKGTPIMDGQRHRVAVEGDKKGRRSGVYIGHLDDFPAGYIHNHKSGEEIRWKASAGARTLTPAEREQHREKMVHDAAARSAVRQHAEAVVAHKALALWNNARPAAAHPYLIAKGVRSHGVKVTRRGDLLVPMRDVAGKLWSVQTISPEGRKLYLTGGRKIGTHAILGGLAPGEPIVIAEGYATAATIRETTSLTAIAAFDSGNLLEVARAYREADPSRPIILAADNDHHLPRREIPLPNVGRDKAEAAAAEVGGVVLLPAFVEADKGTDWNDYAAQHGLDAVRGVVAGEMAKAGITLSVTALRPAMLNAADREAARQAAKTSRPTLPEPTRRLEERKRPTL